MTQKLHVVDVAAGSWSLLTLLGLLGSLGHLAARTFLLLDGLDDTDSHGLPHVTHSKTSQRGVLGEGLHAHGLARLHLDDGSISRLDVLGIVFQLLARTTVDLLNQLRELAGNVSSVAIQDGSVTSRDGSRMVQDDDLQEIATD